MVQQPISTLLLLQFGKYFIESNSLGFLTYFSNRIPYCELGDVTEYALLSEIDKNGTRPTIDPHKIDEDAAELIKRFAFRSQSRSPARVYLFLGFIPSSDAGKEAARKGRPSEKLLSILVRSATV